MARKHFLVKPATGKLLTKMVVGSYLESNKKKKIVHSTSVAISGKEKRFLDIMAQKTGKSVSAYVRDLISEDMELNPEIVDASRSIQYM